MLNSFFTLTFFLQALRISVPYTLPALGATFSERGGVVNIALEGILIISAFATTLGVYYTNNPLVGIIFGISFGLLFALLHAIAAVTFKVDQIVTGIALNLFAIGLTKFSCQLIFNSSSNSSRITGLEILNGTSFSSIPLLGTLLLNPFIPITILLVFISHYVLFKTRFGLRLRAVGEHPEAADSLGIHVTRFRFAGVLISGALTGIGGAWLALDQHSFTDGMSAGRGYIALAAMIIGKWKPLNAAIACLLFGLAETLVIQLQGGAIPVQFIQMLPYVLTMIVLASFIGRAIPPACVGVPYEKESH
jgi:simple sugar transport system permease protein